VLSDIPDLVRRVIIAHAAKPEIRDMLDQNNITERMLFLGSRDCAIGFVGITVWLECVLGRDTLLFRPQAAH